MHIFAALTLMLAVATGAAASYEDDVVRMSVPAQFEGPTTAEPGHGAKVVAFVAKHPAESRGTLLQVSTYDFGAALAGMPEDMRQEGTDGYLKQFLGGIERRRQHFSIVKQEPVVLSGIKASRAEWTGQVEGQPMSGVMYCVIVGTRVVSFHTQDFDDAPRENMNAAIQAITTVVLKSG